MIMREKQVIKDMKEACPLVEEDIEEKTEAITQAKNVIESMINNILMIVVIQKIETVILRQRTQKRKKREEMQVTSNIE